MMDMVENITKIIHIAMIKWIVRVTIIVNRVHRKCRARKVQGFTSADGAFLHLGDMRNDI